MGEGHLDNVIRAKGAVQNLDERAADRRETHNKCFDRSEVFLPIHRNAKTEPVDAISKSYSTVLSCTVSYLPTIIYHSFLTDIGSRDLIVCKIRLPDGKILTTNTSSKLQVYVCVGNVLYTMVRYLASSPPFSVRYKQD